MADVQLENGYTRIANELLEALAMYDFTGQERKFLDAVIRLSYGCGKKTATFPSWSACESFGLPRQHIHSPKKSTGILDKLVLNNVLVVDYDTKTVGIQKYYSKWKIAPKEIASKKKFHALIDYNLKCNLQVTNVTHRLQDKCNPQVTGLSPTGYNDVTHRLQGHGLNPHHHKPETLPKESKEKKDNNNYNARACAMQGSCHSESVEGIQSDLTIIQGAILQKWGKQIVDSPPVAHITTAIEEYGKDKILEAIARTPLILKKPDPMTLMTYIGRVAEHPTWYLQTETNHPKSKKATPQERVTNARRVYEAILNDEQADKEDESYKQALEQAKEELERAEEVYNVSGNA